MTKLVIEDMGKRGKFFNTTRGHFYFEKGDAPRLLPLEKDSVDFSAMIDHAYGINKAEKTEFDHLFNGLVNEAHLSGESVGVHRLAHYDPEKKVLYVSRFDGWMFRLDGKIIRLVNNGTDGVFFWDDPSWEPHEFLPSNKESHLLQEFLFNSANFTGTDGFNVQNQRCIFRTYLLAQFFDSLHPTKLLLLICGPKGGGKTSVLRKVLKFLFGQDAEVTALERSKPDGFIAAVSSLPIAVFDNVDEQVSWLPDHLAQLATGVKFRRRKLYTTNTEQSFKPQCWVALTSRTPKFIEDRDDVLDRTLILKTERLTAYRAEQSLLQEIADNRNLLWSEMLTELNRIVAQIRKQGLPTDSVKFRMADFARFALLVAKAEGQGPMAVQILEQMENQQSDMLLSEEPIAVCLEEWLHDSGNHGKEMSARDLQEELSEIASNQSIGFPYPNAHSLGQKMVHISINLGERFRLEEGKDSANQRWYRFWPKR